MIRLRPRHSFRTQKRTRGLVRKVTRAERAANLEARSALVEGLTPVFEELFGEFRLDVDDEFARQLANREALGIPVSAIANFETAFGTGMQEAMFQAILSGGDIGIRHSGIPGISIPGDLVTQRAENWIANRGAKRIAGINRETVDAVRQITSEALRGDLSPTASVQRISRQVGLSQRQAGALRNFEEQLVRRRIPTPEADTQFVRETIAQDVERARDRMIRERSRAILETEMQEAIQEGEREFWEEAIAQEEVDGGLLAKRWFTVQDDRVCPICAPLHGQVQPFASSFSSLGFTGLGPPAHPRCRCFLEYAPGGEFSTSRTGG